MTKESFDIISLVNNDGCFDLQFRKDTRHERTGSPTYYRWKAQFIITTPKENVAVLKKAKKEIGVGIISLAKPFGMAQGGAQARFSVQKLDDIKEVVIPHFTKNRLAGNKKKNFDLWQRAVDIIWRNKGIYLSGWRKNDLMHLMEIHKAMAKYKQKPKKSKWMDMARALTKKN